MPNSNNAMGVKGCGEAGTIAAPPAVINALLDALAERGVTTIDMAATPAVYLVRTARRRREGGEDMTIERVSPGAEYGALFSAATAADRFVFVGGTTAWDGPSGGDVERPDPIHPRQD